MTLEQMLLALENGKVAYGHEDDYLLLPLDTAHRIAKVVKAGQAMRNRVNIHPSIDNDTASDLIRAARAWDAATKGEGV